MRWDNGRTLVLVLVCILAVGCSARSGSGGSTRADVDVITEAEIDASGHGDAYSLIQSLRPRWLRTRGTSSVALTETIHIYLDGSLLGGPQYLRQIATQSISSVRYLDGLEATQRWGLDHGAGAIVISTIDR